MVGFNCPMLVVENSFWKNVMSGQKEMTYF